VDWKIVSTS